MKTISKTAKKAIAKSATRAIVAAYERYSTKCAMSLLGFVEQSITKHAAEMRDLTSSDEPIIKFIGETNLHACKFGIEYIEIMYNTFEQQVGAEQWEKINQDLDLISSSPETIQEVKNYWQATAKPGKITADDIRQHAE